MVLRSISRTATLTGAASEPVASCPMSMAHAIWPIRSYGTAMVLSAGLLMDANGMSSKPMMLRSSGTLMPALFDALSSWSAR